jgi:hypothetical protein
MKTPKIKELQEFVKDEPSMTILFSILVLILIIITL